MGKIVPTRKRIIKQRRLPDDLSRMFGSVVSIPGTGKKKTSVVTIYKKLDRCKDALERSSSGDMDLKEKVCLMVIEEDLNALMEECEEYLVAGLKPRMPEFHSLRSRSMTVIEELEKLVSPR